MPVCRLWGHLTTRNETQPCLCRRSDWPAFIYYLSLQGDMFHQFHFFNPHSIPIKFIAGKVILHFTEGNTQIPKEKTSNQRGSRTQPLTRRWKYFYSLLTKTDRGSGPRLVSSGERGCVWETCSLPTEGSSGGQDTGDNKSHFVKENGLRCHILEKKSRSLRSYRSQNFQALEEIFPPWIVPDVTTCCINM